MLNPEFPFNTDTAIMHGFILSCLKTIRKSLSLQKAKVFLSDFADMRYTHLTCCLFHVFKTFYVLDLTMEVAQIRAEDATFQTCMINK